MSNISALWKSNKLSCYVLFLWPLHWINTWFTWLFKDQQKTPPCNVGCGNMFLQRSYKGFKKCWLQSADVIDGCGCKMCIHRWCGQLIVLLFSYWEQSASLGHPPLGSLRRVSRAKTFTIPQKTGSELGERKMLIDNLRPWPWGFIVSYDILCSNQVFAG